MRAEMVLEDVKRAYQSLEDETDLRQFRILWVACVVLLRTIDHVLDKVDRINPQIDKAITQLWDDLKSNREDNKIFGEFIEKERNQTSKTYTIWIYQWMNSHSKGRL